VAKVLYVAMMSLDGYIEDEQGNFDWAAPNHEVHRFINDLVRPVRTFLYGRKMYETMAVWESIHAFPEQSPEILDFAEIWQSADKIVYSTSLTSVSSARTRLEGKFNPDAVRQLKSEIDHDIAFGGAHLGGQAFQAGLVDECHLFMSPVIVGGGKRALQSNLRLNLELLDEHRFGSGTVYLRYRIR
jgi:dihydrofolate reductase